MIKNSLIQQFVTAAREMPFSMNWKDDTQQKKQTVSEFLEDGRALRTQMLLHAKQLMEKCPSTSLKDEEGRTYAFGEIDSLIESLQANPKDKRFLKSESSAIRKLTDSSINQHPERIGDYLRFQILCDTVEEIALLRSVVLNADMGATSYKDRLRRPHEEGGHRAFMYHATAENGEKSIKFEGMLCMRQIENFGIDKGMRSLERQCLQGAFTEGVKPKLSNLFTEAADVLSRLRTGSMYELCKTIPGLDSLLDPDIDPNTEIAKSHKSYEAQSASCTELLGGKFGRSFGPIGENPFVNNVIH